MEWNGKWETTLPKPEKLATINDWFAEKFPDWPRLSIQPAGGRIEDNYRYADAAVRALELLDSGRSFIVWQTNDETRVLSIDLKNDDGPGSGVRLPPNVTPPLEGSAVLVPKLVTA